MKSYSLVLHVAGTLIAALLNSARGQTQLDLKTQARNIGAVALTKSDAQANKPWYCNSTTGTSSYTCTLSSAAALTGYTRGMWLTLMTDSTNVGPATLNVDGLGARSIKQSDGLTDVAAGQITAGRAVTIFYDGAVWRLPQYSGVPLNAATNQFVNSIDSSGMAATAQPAFSNLAGSLVPAQMPALTGDVVTSAGSVATSLATVNPTPGVCGDSSHLCQITTNGKGLVTAQSPVALSNSGIASLNGLTAASQTFVNDSNVTVTSSGSSHTLGWSGQLPAARGGLGANASAFSGILKITAGVASVASAGDFPVLNQNSTGNAGGLSAPYIDWNASSGGASIQHKPAIPVITGSSVLKGSGGNAVGAVAADVVSLFGSGSCSGYLKSDATCDPGSGAGANANGYYFVSRSANAPLNAVNLGALSTGIVRLTVSGGVASPSIATAGDFPILNQNTTGNAATAAAFASNPANCPSGQVAAGIDASGGAEGCTTTINGTAIPASKTLMAVDSAVAKAQTPLTTKGDLWVTDGASLHRLGVGTNGQVLTADSTQTDGVKWAAASGTGNVLGPATNHDVYVPQWSGANSKTLADGLSVVPTVGTPGADTALPTEQAVREAIAALPGTSAAGFQIDSGNAGCRWKMSGGVMQLRNAGDTDFCNAETASLTTHGTGPIIETNQTAPGTTPGSGTTDYWVDTTDKVAKWKDDAGGTSVSVRPNACTGQFVQSLGTDGAITCGTPSGSGDVVGPASSVASEIALFDGTTGKLLKRANQTGVLKGTSGVIGTAAYGDIVGLFGSGTCSGYLKSDGSCDAGGAGLGGPIGSYTGTASFSSINDMACGTATITWSGLPAGTPLEVDWTNAPAGTVGKAWATADTVNVNLCNLSGATLTTPSFSLPVFGSHTTTPLTTGTSVTLASPRGYYVCTGTCAVTLPAPTAGSEFCVFDDANVTAAITFQAATGIYYEKPDHSGYGTVSTGTLASTAGTWSKACLIGRDTTHWLMTSSQGTWTAN